MDEKATAPSDDDDEYFDANDEVEESKTSSLEVPAENGHVLSPSISVVTMEGDPAEIEEDKDFKEKDDVSSKYDLFVISDVCVYVHKYLHCTH